MTCAPPPGADTAWRHQANERWIQRALEYQADGTDLLLAGQTPFGELLAAPSAPLLDGIAGCLVDCDDNTRAARLEERGSAWFARSAGHLQAELPWADWVQRHLKWAEWMRRHAVDPTWQPDVIRHGDTDPQLDWSRWSDWKAGDSRWRVRVIDTSDMSPEQVAESLLEWIADERNAKVHPSARSSVGSRTHE